LRQREAGAAQQQQAAGDDQHRRELPPAANRLALVRAGKWLGEAALGFGSVLEAVTPPEEVRPMNAVRTWVLPLVGTVAGSA
jgi:hypothetical protein